MKKKILLILTIILVITSFFTISVFAEGGGGTSFEKIKCNLCGEEHDLVALEKESTLCLTSYEMYNGLYGELFSDTDGLGGLSTQGLLSFKTSGELFDKLWEAISVNYNYIAIVGEILIFIYFLLQLVEENTQHDGFTYESFTRMCLRTFLAFMLINNGLRIATFLIDLAAELFGNISYVDPAQLGYLFKPDECPYEIYMAGHNTLDAIADIFMNCVPYAAMTVAKVLVMGILYARLIEIMVRITFAPIGMFDIFQKGRQGNGWIYLKKLFASLLQGACIAAVFLAYSYVNLYIRDSVGGILGSVVLAFTLVGLTLKSQEIARDVVGVN